MSMESRASPPRAGALLVHESVASAVLARARCDEMTKPCWLSGTETFVYEQRLLLSPSSSLPTSPAPCSAGAL
jgi:hypothetical protein